MKKRFLVLLITVVFALPLIALIPLRTEASGMSVTIAPLSDPYVFVPGRYDMVASVSGAQDPAYQWFVGVGRNQPLEERIALEEGYAWQGTKTNHLSCTTADGMVYTEDGSGFDGLYFSCRVTDSDGTIRWSDEMNMTVFSHESLLKRLEKDEAGFTRIYFTSGNGSVLSAVENEGVRYFTAVDDFSKGGLIPSHVYSTLAKELREYSEVSLKVEVYVTYDGKTVPFETGGKGFVPQKYGQNVVSFRSDLVLYVDGQRLETIDSSTSVVSVLLPEDRGIALTNKNAVKVIAEPHDKAKTLTTMGNDERVTILSEAGSYYRVAAGGYFGYIWKQELDVVPEVNSVAIEVQEPTAGSAPDGLINVIDKDLYEAESKFNQEIWYDITADKYMKQGDRFIAGHKYRLIAWLTVKNNKIFSNKAGKPDVVAEVNGLKAKVATAYEQDPEQVIEVTIDFDHVHDLQKVNRTYPTCTAAGKEYHYMCSCGWCFEDNNGVTKIIDENWGVIPALGHWESEWKSNGTQHYRVCQRRGCGETIEGTKGSHTGGTSTCTSGAICTVCGIAYGEKSGHSFSSNWDYRDVNGHAHMCTSLCGEHSALQPHRPGKEATATEPQVCLDCGFVLAQPVNHTHDIKAMEAKAATCTEAGYGWYWYCEGCGELYGDAEGLNRIVYADVFVSPLGHDIDLDWKYDGSMHWHVCRRCGEVIAESKEDHVLVDGKCDVCGYVDEAAVTPAPTDQETSQPTDPALTPSPADATETTTPGEPSASPSSTGDPSEVSTAAPYPGDNSPEPVDQKNFLKSSGWLVLVIGLVLAVLIIVAAIVVFKAGKKRRN